LKTIPASIPSPDIAVFPHEPHRHSLRYASARARSSKLAKKKVLAWLAQTLSAGAHNPLIYQDYSFASETITGYKGWG
jgi:hypothetical protein